MHDAQAIAIVGRGCVLPGCLTLDALWQAISKQQDLLTRSAFLASPDDSLIELPVRQARRRSGGYIQGFDQVFTPERFSLGGINAATLDAVVQWPLHAVLDAWQEADEPETAKNRTGVILANLSYPTKGKADYTCSHWIQGHSDKSALNAFNSGLPAQLIARALSANGGAFSLDAACASSLYALQIACRKLQQDKLDVAVVSAVNAAHDVMLQHGFSALQALSPTGQSQPFAATADGLVPAQGAAAVILKRVSDVNDGETVYGVIRAIGLSNDGRRGGFLVPDSQGQLEAMQQAYQQCDVSSDSIDYLECHATGTPVGDGIEIRSASKFFGKRSRLPVGSLKSNTGHLITVAGLASVLKLTLAMEHDTLPPTRVTGELNASFDDSCLFPQTRCEPWQTNKLRRAAISNFGFGGNNAHLIMEEYKSSHGVAADADSGSSPGAGATSIRQKTAHLASETHSKKYREDPATASLGALNSDKRQERIVICAMGAMAGCDRGTDRIVRRLMSSPSSMVEHCSSITIDPLSLRTPPADLHHIEPQQLALLAVVDDAVHQLGIDTLLSDNSNESKAMLSTDRIAVFAGMGCASDACRWLLREQLADYFGDSISDSTLKSLKDSVVAPMTAADVLGAMPNMPANRISAAYDFRAQGYSVSAEEQSDTVALQLGCEALKAHDIDLAVVAAADFASESVRAAALSSVAQLQSAQRSLNEPHRRFTDKACAILLLRESTAKQLGLTVLSSIDQDLLDGVNGVGVEAIGVEVVGEEVGEEAAEASATAEPYRRLIERVYGSAPITDTLFSMVVATALANRGQQVVRQITEPRLATSRSQSLRFGPSTFSSDVRATSSSWTLELAQANASPDPLRKAPYLYYVSADSNQDLCELIQQRAVGGTGCQRVAVIAESQGQLDERLAQAVATLSTMPIALDEPALAEASVVTSSGSSALKMNLSSVQAAPEGVFLGNGKPNGELAFVYTGSAAAYPRMGRGLLMAFPSLGKDLVAAFPSLDGVAHLLSQSSFSAYEELCAVTLLSQAQTLVLRNVLQLSPDAIIGLSLGETNALYAFGLWNDTASLLDDSEIVSMYELQLGGEFRCASDAWEIDGPIEWTNWRIYAPMAAVENAVALLPHTDITIIYSDDDCIIGGPLDECQTLVETLGAGSGVLMNQHLIVHTPTLQPYAATWRKVHTRPTAEPVDVRVYSHAEHKSYEPDQHNIAEQLTRQALQTIDFRKMIEQAYADGIRTFVEIGPRDSLTKSVAKILGSREHRAVAVDSIDQSDTTQLAQLAAVLYADGHDIDIAALADELHKAHLHPWTVRAARPSDINIKTGFDMPDWPQRSQAATMPLAPTLPAPKADFFQAPAPAALKSAAVDVPLAQRSPQGPHFDRDALELASRGPMSTLFGDMFKAQDGYVRQVRLPAPPLLMVDRIVGIDAEPGVEATGTIWTETDILADQWYLHANTMRTGPLIESGQADLSLISWMGADFRNRDERVYRLLGCETVMHDGHLPKVGDTLCYQIEITGHAEINGMRLFFFQYDCRVDGRLVFSVRHGQAGFFTDAELASSKGVLIDLANEAPPTENPSTFDISRASKKRSFSKSDLSALRDGDAFACFGKGFEHCAAHSNPPRLPGGKLALFDEVSEFNPTGGAWGRGYLQALATVPVDAWFYDGHFHNDPCMPGTLMAEAAVQALECLAMAMGLNCQRDGWVFEPLPGSSARFECRGQVIPDQQHVLTYDVHVDQIIDGDLPEVHAALITSCDGHKVFYCPNYKIRMRRQWPALPSDLQPVQIGPQQESRGDWHALLACGNGAPSHAFGDMYRPMDASARVPRLPQPPYHMISRVLSVSTRPNSPEVGATVVSEYDVTANEWYFKDGRNGEMPFAVLLEVALQPCGWLGSHGGFALHGGECFRNLDGDGQIHQNVEAVDQCIRVESKMTRFSTMGPMTIVHFDVVVDSSLGYRVMSLETSFGFFPMDALDRQVGLDTNQEQLATRKLTPTHCPVDDPLSLLPTAQMLMVDEVNFFEPLGGPSGQGLIRGQQTVDPYAWYFKAHFYQDPVQPGSLGLDALLQLLARGVLLKGITRDMQNPQFKYIAPEQSLRWSYRGQVTPSAQTVTLVVEIDSIDNQDGGDVLVKASGSLWRDDLRIYEAENLSILVLNND